MSEQASREDIESLAEKLDMFAASLPDQERDILAQILENASEGAEVDGFAQYASFSSPVSWGLAQSLGPQLTFSRGFSASYFQAGGGSMLPKE